MEIRIEEKCKASVTFHGIAVNEKLWLKWKGRKAVVGWTARRAPVWRKEFSYITFSCKKREHVGNMTPEAIEEIKTMMYLLKEH
jgi:hypothetical protein